MKKYLIAIDDGHELSTAGKRTPPIPDMDNLVIKENEFNKAVAILLQKELERNGFDTLMVADTDNDTLKDRVQRANKKNADIFVSIHYNAMDGQFDGEGKDPSGISVHVYPRSSNSRKLGNCILNWLVKGTNQKNRGLIESNFYVLRETKMPAILSENGFMDNLIEAKLMIDDAFIKEVAVEHCKGICDYFDVVYVESEENNILHLSEKYLDVVERLKDIRDSIESILK